MVCPNNAQVREQLETLYQRSPSRSLATQFAQFFQAVGAALVQELTRDRTAPRISKFYNIEGKARWHVFDPLSGQRFTVHSEHEVLDWLDRRYSV